MTPEDILNKRFERATVGGYRADDVNAFVEAVAIEFEQFYKERESLQEKLIILADKLEEYRNDEESMRSALLGAQKLGDSIIRDSKEKSEELLLTARKEAESIVETAKMKATKIEHEIKTSIETEQLGLQRLQREVAQFKQKMLVTYQQHIDLIQAIPYDEALPPRPNPLQSNITKKKNKLESLSQETELEEETELLVNQSVSDFFEEIDMGAESKADNDITTAEQEFDFSNFNVD